MPRPGVTFSHHRRGAGPAVLAELLPHVLSRSYTCDKAVLSPSLRILYPYYTRVWDDLKGKLGVWRTGGIQWKLISYPRMDLKEEALLQQEQLYLLLREQLLSLEK